MGFGHRIFRHGDPRTAAIGEALKGFGPDAGRLAFAAKLERRVGAVFRRLKPGWPALQQNIEINAALLLDAAGFARDAFTPVFAIGRCPGWIAHAWSSAPNAAWCGRAPAISGRGRPRADKRGPCGPSLICSSMGNLIKSPCNDLGKRSSDQQ
jgi:citrate synthase